MIEERLGLLRLSKMFAYKEMEKPEFSFAQVCSNGHVPFQHSYSPFIKEMGYIGCPNGYSIHIAKRCSHMVVVH